MATCAVIGQAAGTAAALCAKHNCLPRALSGGAKLRELQRILMNDDCWLPGVSRPVSSLALDAKLAAGGQGAPLLLDGLDRDRENEAHAWMGSLGTPIEYHWNEMVNVGGARFVFDSNLANEKRMPCSYPQKGNRDAVPSLLVKSFRLEAQDENGQWRLAHRDSENYQRLVTVPLGVRAKALRFVPEETWGAEAARVFAFEPVIECESKNPVILDGPHFSEVRARISDEDMAAPDSGLEESQKLSHSA
jgi:hypothetical protein